MPLTLMLEGAIVVHHIVPCIFVLNRRCRFLQSHFLSGSGDVNINVPVNINLCILTRRCRVFLVLRAQPYLRRLASLRQVYTLAIEAVRVCGEIPRPLVRLRIREDRSTIMVTATCSFRETLAKANFVASKLVASLDWGMNAPARSNSLLINMVPWASLFCSTDCIQKSVDLHDCSGRFALVVEAELFQHYSQD